MTTLHEILYTIDAKQKVSVAVKYDEFTAPGQNVICREMKCFTGYPPDLMSYIDSGTLKHLAAITGVKDGVIQITSHPVAKLNKYKAYYAYAPVMVCKGANIDVVKDIEATNLNDALNQAFEKNSVVIDTGTVELKLIGINLIEGIG